MIKRRRLLFLLKAIILTILFCSAVYFENAQQQRVYILVAVFSLYLVNGVLREFKLKHDGNLFFLSFLLDIAMVFILEYNSRLLINYFFHSFYIVILLEASLSLNLKKGILIGIVTVLVSLIKYGYLIYYKFNFSSISQMAFFMMVNVLILVVAGFALHNKEERERKDILYKELLNTHKQLKEYSDEVKRLTVVEERNRIARDIHDSLGHNMTALIMQLQMTEHLLKEDTPKAEELLKNTIKTAKDSMAGIREVVETLRGNDVELSTSETLRSLVSEFSEKTGTEIKLDIAGTENIGDQTLLKSGVNTAVLRIVQESLTNAIRHGKATKISIHLNYKSDSIEFFVTNNGVTAGDLKEGFGLKGIRERVEAYGGHMEYGDISESDEFKGSTSFFIKGVLNLEGENDKSSIG